MSARDVSPFVGWHCSGVFCHVRCAEPCAWCSDEAAKNEAALAAAGLVVVPVEPTDGMCEAARARHDADDRDADKYALYRSIGRAMIAAAPQEASDDGQ